MQVVAAERSGCAGKFRCFWRGEFKNSLFRFIYLNQAQHHIRSQPGSALDWSPPGYGAGPSSPQWARCFCFRV